ncbi:MAG: type I glyceraldehyde-3-phosphate dehydrogenase [Patescibacteria group bacterium]|nr:type I glyceraldehyde-3-phosphate dehydrogenase [Patescibacteria group bacterium]MCL5431933.1 type I glyceraldehyde-3-phosphate dehydrogenase [Patescibacteria group bacterium]
MIKVAINGYGRIGRVAHRVMLERFTDKLELVAINGGTSTDIAGWAYLLKYDTAYGILKGHQVSGEEGNLIVDGKKIPFFTEKDPTALPWKMLGVDVVIEATGHFTTEEKIKDHLIAGAKKVILSAPAKDHSIKTFVLGVNQAPGDATISNASCTTNSVAPVAQIMAEKFGVEKAMLTTVHSYTSDQELQDGGHKDFRRARAAAQNIIPTSTGATIAATEAVPELKDLFTGLAIRVPTIVGSLSDFTFLLKRATTKEEINKAFEEAAASDRYKNILEVTSDPIVSSDIKGNPHSAIVDLSLTQVVGGNLAKVIAWYDNEWGYANRLVEEVAIVGSERAGE